MRTVKEMLYIIETQIINYTKVKGYAPNTIILNQKIYYKLFTLDNNGQAIFMGCNVISRPNFIINEDECILGKF